MHYWLQSSRKIHITTNNHGIIIPNSINVDIWLPSTQHVCTLRAAPIQSSRIHIISSSKLFRLSIAMQRSANFNSNHTPQELSGPEDKFMQYIYMCIPITHTHNLRYSPQISLDQKRHVNIVVMILEAVWFYANQLNNIIKTPNATTLISHKQRKHVNEWMN